MFAFLIPFCCGFKGRDLSPVTDSLWKIFYEKEFGVQNAETVIKRMKQKKVVFKWRLLYEVLYHFLGIC